MNEFEQSVKDFKLGLEIMSLRLDELIRDFDGMRKRQSGSMGV